MGICEKCRDMSPENVLRQSGDVLCFKCERIRVDTLAKEREQRARRSPPEPSTTTSSCDETNSFSTTSSAKPSTASSTKKKPKSQVTCIPGCKRRNKKASGSSIRCCLCAQWFHEKCVKLNEFDTVGIWPCPNCRGMSQDIKRADTNISKLSTAVSELTEALVASQLQQEKMLSELSHIKELNKNLAQQNDELIKEFQSLKQDNSQNVCPPAATHSLLIGSSLIRNFDEAKLNDYRVCCMPGAVMADIQHKLETHVKDGLQFKSVKIVAGGNDASRPQDNFNSEESAAALTAAIRAAKSLAPDVTVAAIPPRTQPNHAMDNIEILNGIFRSVSEEMSVSFATNDDHFFLKNGSINEGYLYDSVHLTLKGANKLAESLGLKNIANGQNIGVCSFKPSQPRCFDHKSGLPEGMESEQTDFEHPFWSAARSKASKSRLMNKKRTVGPVKNTSAHHTSRAPQNLATRLTQPETSTSSRPTNLSQPQPNTLPRHQHQGIIKPHQRSVGHFQDFNRSSSRNMTPQGRRQGHGHGRSPNPPAHHRDSTQRMPSHPHMSSALSRHPPSRHGPGANHQRAPQPVVDQRQFRNTSGRQVNYSQITQTNRVPQPRFHDHQRSYVMNSNNEHCVFCGEINHRSWSCKHGLPIKCFSCGTDGHKSRFCPGYKE